jgi:hypothetical protein
MKNEDEAERKVYGHLTPDGITIYGKDNQDVLDGKYVIIVDASGMDGVFAGTVEEL